MLKNAKLIQTRNNQRNRYARHPSHPSHLRARRMDPLFRLLIHITAFRRPPMIMQRGVRSLMAVSLTSQALRTNTTSIPSARTGSARPASTTRPAGRRPSGRPGSQDTARSKRLSHSIVRTRTSAGRLRAGVQQD